jgi:hypothetical protein
LAAVDAPEAPAQPGLAAARAASTLRDGKQYIVLAVTHGGANAGGELAAP